MRVRKRRGFGEKVKRRKRKRLGEDTEKIRRERTVRKGRGKIIRGKRNRNK